MIKNFVDNIGGRVRWGYFSAFIILLCTYILTFYTNQQLNHQSEMVNRTNVVINTLDNLESSLITAESSVRGYLLNNDETFLNDYNKSPVITDSVFKKLRWLTLNNKMQEQQLDSLKLLISERMILLGYSIQEFITSNHTVTDSMKMAGQKTKTLMTEIRKIKNEMRAQEYDVMAKRNKSVTAFSQSTKIISIVSLIIAILLIFYSVDSFNKSNEARKAADKNAEAFQKQLELRVEELNKLNTELVELKSNEKFAATGRISRTIAHEVRNPLTNINLATEHLKSEISSTDEINILFEMISRNSNRINQLISDLLNSTKATPLNFEKVIINDLLDSSLAFAQDRIELKRIKVFKDYKSECDILVDVQKINIAFLNIIVNAIEAMEPGTGVLNLATETTNNRCIATISDNGKGMDEEELISLFEPYFTTKENGTGLGLTNTQNIIISHKASIKTKSIPGKGSSFIISFPLT
jgi:signal transduction histidine kinase